MCCEITMPWSGKANEHCKRNLLHRRRYETKAIGTMHEWEEQHQALEQPSQHISGSAFPM